MSVNTKTKYFYGLGFISVGIKDILYTLFVFFYFNQILGLDPVYTGAATFIAIFFDAFSDPLIGIISDSYKSKIWGRRHPFMLVSAIPLGLSTWLLFIPPSFLSEFELFCWLTSFSILIRFFLTIYLVPAMSLGAELTPNYEERTVITSFRITFTVLMQPFIFLVGVYLFFIQEEGMTTGLENADAYAPFAFFCGTVMTLSILISTYGTKNTIPYLPKESKKENLNSIFKNIKTAFKMKSFRSVVFFTAMVYTAFGIGNTMSTYLLTYVFEFNEIDILSIVFAGALGGLISAYIAPKFGKIFDKKNATIICTILFSLGMASPYILRLLNLMPLNDDPFVVLSFFILYSFGFTFLWSAMSLSTSMMADVVDQYETFTNKRHEGMFFSSLSFSYKCTIGLGYLGGGILLKFISFPTQTKLEDIDPQVITDLTIIGGPFIFLVYISSMLFLLGYPINKKMYNKIRNQLDLNKNK